MGIILLLYAPAINKEFLILASRSFALSVCLSSNAASSRSSATTQRTTSRKRSCARAIYIQQVHAAMCRLCQAQVPKAQQHRIRRDPEVGKDVSFCYVGYVGSTNITVAKREYNRVANLRQLQQLKLPKTEIAIRYWHDTQTYDQFSTLLLSQHSEYIDAWTEEHCIIQRWQPKLNPPFLRKNS